MAASCRESRNATDDFSDQVIARCQLALELGRSTLAWDPNSSPGDIETVRQLWCKMNDYRLTTFGNLLNKWKGMKI